MRQIFHAPWQFLSILFGGHFQAHKVTDRRSNEGGFVFEVILFLLELPHLGQLAQNTSQIGGNAWLFRNNERFGHKVERLSIGFFGVFFDFATAIVYRQLR